MRIPYSLSRLLARARRVPRVDGRLPGLFNARYYAVFEALFVYMFAANGYYRNLCEGDQFQPKCLPKAGPGFWLRPLSL